MDLPVYQCVQDRIERNQNEIQSLKHNANCQ